MVDYKKVEESVEALSQLAYAAYSNISFSPERRRDTIIAEAKKELVEDLKELEKQGSVGNYQEKYLEHFSGWLTRKGRTMSAMITGPARFPVNKNRKAMNSEDNAWKAFVAWRARYFKAVYRVPTPSPEEDLDNAIKDLDILIINQEMMKAANKINRSKSKTKTCELLESGWELGSVIKMVGVEYKLFPSFSLTNNNAKIKARKDKIIIMKRRIETKESFEEIFFEGGSINIEADRVVIKHDDKPSRDVIDSIKKRGFRWSRNFACWSRKHTAAALYDAKQIVGL